MKIKGSGSRGAIGTGIENYQMPQDRLDEDELPWNPVLYTNRKLPPYVDGLGPFQLIHAPRMIVLKGSGNTAFSNVEPPISILKQLQMENAQSSGSSPIISAHLYKLLYFPTFSPIAFSYRVVRPHQVQASYSFNTYRSPYSIKESCWRYWPSPQRFLFCPVGGFTISTSRFQSKSRKPIGINPLRLNAFPRSLISLKPSFWFASRWAVSISHRSS